MKLSEDFFEITASRVREDRAEFSVRLNAGHPVYAAHFPGNPVTPGVCIIQMVEELAEVWLERPLALRAAKRIKFLNVIDPVSSPVVRFVLDRTSGEEGEVSVVAAVTGENDDAFSQLSLTFFPEHTTMK